MQKKIIIILISAQSFFSFSQSNLVKDLIENKYQLVKMKFGTNPNSLQEYDQQLVQSGIKSPDYKMRGLIYDSTSSIHKQLIKESKCKSKDTLLIYDWDFQGFLAPFQCVSKFRFNSKDSILKLCDIKYLNMHYKNVGQGLKVRNFKVVQAAKGEIVLLDKDKTDVSRSYYLKKKDK